MDLFQAFLPKGWRRSGTINVTLAYVCDIILLILWSISVSRQDTSPTGSTIIFSGNCDLSTRLNLILHLLVNIVSGVILASSNFFMQVLNSPSRKEIDEAHSWLRSVDIGVPSLKNLRHVSRFKSISWLVFLFSSFPIHLFFNSVVFHTAYEGSQWHLTIATEAFIKGAPYFPPGASLSPSGAAGPGYKWIEGAYGYAPPYNITYYHFNDSLGGCPFNGYGNGWPSPIWGYGESVAWDHYRNASSAIYQSISSVAIEAGAWDVLNATSCQMEYLSCKPRTDYSDVVVIIDLEDSAGWIRSEVFDFGSNSSLTSHWDSVVHPDKANSLWFSAQCATVRDPQSREASCNNTCNGALGQNDSLFFIQDVPPVQEPWSIPFFPPVRLHNQSLFGEGIALNYAYNALLVDYCLARPAAHPVCKVGVSNALLLVVIGSILLKAIQGTIVVWKLSSESLVTPGDAIQSFISNPDSRTQGLGTLQIADSWRLEYGLRRRWTPIAAFDFTTSINPRKWERKQPLLFYVIHKNHWIQTYSFLTANLALLLFGLICLNLTFISTLLFANTPQLIFSVCYSVYNAIITRLQVEKEWNSFSQSYQPLRVSYPSGHQVSTYRLQLPYGLSIPLIGISILFHWLASSAIFLYVVDGGYLDGELYSSSSLENIFHVSNNSLITLGYSTGFILLVLILSVVLIICPPLIFGFQRLRGNMVFGGSNSLVISAACHVTTLPGTEGASCLTEGNQSDSPRGKFCCLPVANEIIGLMVVDIPLLKSQYTESESVENRTQVEKETSLPLVQRKLRWGAMVLPREVDGLATFENERMVSHLGFGGEEHNITEPEEVRYYV
ncbi:hypothetical protein F5Y10DRAFT_289156 [Nemania abortiva]|nr:hypothetical protein F5Y10DRAFT_289156 [Nemania abortiva]